MKTGVQCTNASLHLHECLCFVQKDNGIIITKAQEPNKGPKKGEKGRKGKGERGI